MNACDEGDHVPSDRAKPRSVDEYIASFSPEVRTILENIRLTIREAAPGAQETISYEIPTFKLGGPLVYFGAFQKHIGFYPPVSGNATTEKAVSRYAGDKGNLRFPLDEPIPYALIKRIVKFKVKQNMARTTAKSRKAR